MTSINTNLAAVSALRTLQSTNTDLDATQKRISTGLKIGEAKDNAAYWSITTTLKSDNKALGTVKDALSLGAATVDTAYQGLNETLDVLNEIKTKLTAATNPNVDKAAVQDEIEELQKQLRAIATAATFSGENWLSVKSDAVGYVADKAIVSSFNRNGGNVSLDTISIATASFVLIDTKANTHGLLEGSTTADAGANSAAFVTALTTGTSGAAGTTAAPKVTTFGTTTQKLGRDDQIDFTIAVNGGTPLAVRIDFNLINDTLKVTDGRIDNAAGFKAVLDAAFAKAGVTVTTAADNAAGTVSVSSTTSIAYASVAASGKGGVLDINIEGKTRAQIESMITTVDNAAKAVTSAAATLGAVAARFEMQKTFVTTLMDTIDKGVSGLVDADMNEESTKLQALQVKQQLGVQALSIANQSAQNVLSLFRG